MATWFWGIIRLSKIEAVRFEVPVYSVILVVVGLTGVSAADPIDPSI